MDHEEQNIARNTRARSVHCCCSFFFTVAVLCKRVDDSFVITLNHLNFVGSNKMCSRNLVTEILFAWLFKSFSFIYAFDSLDEVI